MKYYYKKFEDKFMKVSVDEDGEIVDAEMITVGQFESETPEKTLVYQKTDNQHVDNINT